MSTNGVEVAQEDSADGCTAVAEVGDDVFVNLLGVAIRTFGLFAWRTLRDGQVFGVGLTIDGTATGEDETFHAKLGH